MQTGLEGGVDLHQAAAMDARHVQSGADLRQINTCPAAAAHNFAKREGFDHEDILRRTCAPLPAIAGTPRAGIARNRERQPACDRRAGRGPPGRGHGLQGRRIATVGSSNRWLPRASAWRRKALVVASIAVTRSTCTGWKPYRPHPFAPVASLPASEAQKAGSGSERPQPSLSAGPRGGARKLGAGRRFLVRNSALTRGSCGHLYPGRFGQAGSHQQTRGAHQRDEEQDYRDHQSVFHGIHSWVEPRHASRRSTHGMDLNLTRPAMGSLIQVKTSREYRWQAGLALCQGL